LLKDSGTRDKEAHSFCNESCAEDFTWYSTETARRKGGTA